MATSSRSVDAPPCRVGRLRERRPDDRLDMAAEVGAGPGSARRVGCPARPRGVRGLLLRSSPPRAAPIRARPGRAAARPRLGRERSSPRGRPAGRPAYAAVARRSPRAAASPGSPTGDRSPGRRVAARDHGLVPRLARRVAPAAAPSSSSGSAAARRSPGACCSTIPRGTPAPRSSTAPCRSTPACRRRRAAGRVPVFVAQGTQDMVIPRELLDRTWDYLLGESGAPTIARRDPVGHGIDRDALATLAGWLHERFSLALRRPCRTPGRRRGLRCRTASFRSGVAPSRGDRAHPAVTAQRQRPRRAPGAALRPPRCPPGVTTGQSAISVRGARGFFVGTPRGPVTPSSSPRPVSSRISTRRTTVPCTCAPAGTGRGCDAGLGRSLIRSPGCGSPRGWSRSTGPATTRSWRSSPSSSRPPTPGRPELPRLGLLHDGE